MRGNRKDVGVPLQDDGQIYVPEDNPSRRSAPIIAMGNVAFRRWIYVICTLFDRNSKTCLVWLKGRARRLVGSNTVGYTVGKSGCMQTDIHKQKCIFKSL